ncbi:uncharacterized protein LOC135485742 [Lineus longissimus]|uniref:uncharacterized protein LOC135485742 n=1 Tax=Lineus longissimus TaxID=88925 RepID=UPI00315D00F9
MYARLPKSVILGAGYSVLLEKLPEHPHFNFNYLKDDSQSINNKVWQFLQVEEETGLSNRDSLSLYFTAKGLEGFEESATAYLYWTPVKLLFRTLHHLNLIPRTKSELQLHAKLKKIETKFLTLQKNYNARCCRGGEKQKKLLEEFLSRPFQMQSVASPAVPSAAPPGTVTVSSPALSPPRTISTVISPLIKTPRAASPYSGGLRSVETGVQVNSPQIKTTPAIRRSLTATKRELFKVQSSVGRKADELSRQAEKHEHLKFKIRQKENKIIELNNKCKQVVNSADGKRVKALEKEVGQLKNQIKELKATVEGLLDNENQMAESLVSATNRYVDSEKRVRAVRAGKRRATQKLSDIRRHILAICSNLKTGSGDVMVMDLCASLQQMPDIDKNTSATLKEIVSGLTAPLPTKEKGAFKEHIAVLAMQLQLLGVPQNTVGEVMNECSKRLYNRCLSDSVSARTAGRMIRQGGILSDAQLALALSDTSSRGLRVGQDTTTRGGVEHVATAWAGRSENNEVFNMQSRVAWLPNHIAETQLEHIKCVVEKSNDLLKTLDLEPQTKASLAYVVDFMGDHVNSKLVRLLREKHLSDLEELVENGELTDSDREVFSELFYSACQMHSGAKVSRSFYEGMRAIEPPDLAKTFGKYGIRRGAGSTFDSLGARVVEFASTQFSPDQSNTADFNWSGVFPGWCDEHGHSYIKLDFVNKNRHYRHEHNSGRLIELTDSILHFYQDQLSTRDDGLTLRNKDQLVFECLQNDEVKSQLTAADSLDAMFFKPFMAMLKAEETDVITVGPYIRKAYEFLHQAGNEEEFARSMLSGMSLLYEGEHLRRDGKDFRKKPVGVSVYGDGILERSVAYLMAGCQTAAKGLRKISSEYFDGGHYFKPSVKQSVLLSGFDAHSDRLESNLGQFSQQRSRMPHARVQTITSHVSMRANKTVAAIGRDERLMSCLPKVRKET